MHLTFEDIGKLSDGFSVTYEFQTGTDLDAAIFYSVPSSFFVTDSRIPRILRELVTEAEGCQKMNFLTGAAACTRKAIYEFTILEEAKGDDYETRIKHLKKKFGNIDPSHFEILCSIKDITSPNRVSHRGFTSMGALV